MVITISTLSYRLHFKIIGEKSGTYWIAELFFGFTGAYSNSQILVFKESFILLNPLLRLCSTKPIKIPDLVENIKHVKFIYRDS